MQDKAAWSSLPLQERTKRRRTAIALMQEMIRLADEKMKLSSFHSAWMADRANLRGCLVLEYQSLAAGGIEPEQNLARALELAEQSAADFRKILELDPKVFVHRMGLVYALNQVAAVSMKIQPDGGSLAKNYEYNREKLRTDLDMQKDSPEHPLTQQQLLQALNSAGGVTAVLGEDAAKFLQEPLALNGFLDVVELLPASGAFPDPRLNEARERTANQLKSLREKKPLPERAAKLLDSWASPK